MQDLIWEEGDTRLILSPRAGGRLTSWRRAGRELVQPLHLTEGGLLRVLFAEEQYPGAAYATPHQVIDQARTDAGFRAHLRCFWNTPNGFMRDAGWPDKANELHIDGILLDKVVTYDHALSCLTCELTFTNLTGEVKFLTPWLHHSFTAWPTDRWVARDGVREAYHSTDIYWGDHLASSARTMRLVQAAADGSLFACLGASTDDLRGMSAMTPIPGEYEQATAELRHQTLRLPPGEAWRSTSFLAITGDPSPWLDQAPIEPATGPIQPASIADEAICPPALLQTWMLDAEREQGLMVLSYLDKPPFATPDRYAGSHAFAGFEPQADRAVAWVMLYASCDLPAIRAELAGPEGWAIAWGQAAPSSATTLELAKHDFKPLRLIGPSSLAGKDQVQVTLTLPDGKPVTLRVASDATVASRFPYQARQTPTYLQQRYDDLLGPPAGATGDQVTAWQNRARGRLTRWLASNAAGPCDLAPRLVERQEGPTCVRDKWLVQTEPGVWVPGYFVRPRGMTGRRPVLYFLHGSGLGKEGFAPDETERIERTQLSHELEHMPYRLAVELNCLVYVPDGRGQGELGETNPYQWTTRLEAMGLSNVGLRLWDQMRALDWLLARDDVDPARVGSVGCSGGGQMTYLFAAADERVAASIVSSTNIAAPLRAELPDGYFHRELIGRDARIAPAGPALLHGPPTGMLVAPRPMWIVDGLDDLLTPGPERDAWRANLQAGRDQIRAAYRALDADDRFQDCWLEGGHCAGMTVDNVAAWFDRWLGEEAPGGI